MSKSTMQALMHTRYTRPETLRLSEVAKPTPQAGEVLVKVRATSVNYNTLALVTGDPVIVRMMTGAPFQPKHFIPGNDVAGVVEAVGANVTRFKVGDEVYGDTSEHGFGTFAEYVAAPETALTRKPANCSFEEAAAAPESALVALQALRDKGGIQPGYQVLIQGASGGIGTYAVQLAKQFGAEVTALCSPRNVDLARSLGADHIIDYTRDDFARRTERYDLIVATVGYYPLSVYKRALKPNGKYVSTGGTMRQIFEALLLGSFMSSGGQRMSALVLKSNKDLPLITDLMEQGRLKSVIDRCYPLDQAAEALRYYGERRARGKIVISVP